MKVGYEELKKQKYIVEYIKKNGSDNAIVMVFAGEQKNSHHRTHYSSFESIFL